MKQMVVAVFDNETAALEGLSELRNLHSEAGVSLYASAVIVKDNAGRVSVKQYADQGPAGLLLGMVVGGLVSVLGGPGAVPLGAYIGGLAEHGGTVYRRFRVDVAEDRLAREGAAVEVTLDAREHYHDGSTVEGRGSNRFEKSSRSRQRLKNGSAQLLARAFCPPRPKSQPF